MQTDITSKGLRDSEEERGESQRFRFLCQDIGDTATQELTCQPILSRHYASMTQDGLQIAGTRWGRGRDASTPRTHTHPFEWLASGLSYNLSYRPGMGCKILHFF